MVNFEDIYESVAIQYCVLRGYDPRTTDFENEKFKEIVKKWYDSFENKVYISAEEKNIPAQSI